MNTEVYTLQENSVCRSKWTPPGTDAEDDACGMALCLPPGFAKGRDAILNSASQTPGFSMNY